MLTFDDGPDPEWTPRILDVLKQKNATATFFLIGIQTDKFSSLAKRIFKEGHTIGNHTFTHPDVSNISSTYMKVELNLTERLFASLMGIRTKLLRPPYAIDEEPDTADQVKPLEAELADGGRADRVPPAGTVRLPVASRRGTFAVPGAGRQPAGERDQPGDPGTGQGPAARPGADGDGSEHRQLPGGARLTWLRMSSRS